MTEDKGQDRKAPGISQGVKKGVSPKPSQGAGWKPIKIKSEEQAEAERLFFLFFPEASHWEPPSILLPFDPITYVPYLKEVALAILSTGIIGEDGLKGSRETFPVNQRDLIGTLVDTHYKYTNITYYPGDIIRRFDNLFKSLTAFVRLAGVKDSGPLGIKKVQNEWRKKVHLAVSQGNFPSNWRELTKVDLISAWKYRPRSEAHAFAIIFLHYAPQASDNRIALWVNATLESLGRPTASQSKLRDYISKERKLRPWLPQKPSKNPL